MLNFLNDLICVQVIQSVNLHEFHLYEHHIDQQNQNEQILNEFYCMLEKYEYLKINEKRCLFFLVKKYSIYDRCFIVCFIYERNAPSFSHRDIQWKIHSCSSFEKIMLIRSIFGINPV